MRGKIALGPTLLYMKLLDTEIEERKKERSNIGPTILYVHKSNWTYERIQKRLERENKLRFRPTPMKDHPELNAKTWWVQSAFICVIWGLG